MNKLAVFGMILAVLAVLTVPAAAQEYDIFHLVPPDSSCTEAGCNTTVWVKVNVSQNDVSTFQAAIIFDPKVVNVTNVEIGSTNWPVWAWDRGDYGNMKYVRMGGAYGTFGPGELELGKMTLECNNTGLSALHFGNQSELGADRTQIGNKSGMLCGPLGNECDMRDGTFACGVVVETFTKPLPDVGWNLISLPLTPLDNSTSAVLSSMSGKYDAVYSFDAGTKDFVDVSTGTMDPGIGYFVHVTTAGTWTYNGVAKTSINVPLEQGLNMVGWLNCSKDIVSDNALSSIDGNYYYAARWNATAQEFETYNPVAPNGFNDFATMDRGEGYFISAKAAGTLSESC